MTERFQDSFDVAKYALKKLTDEDRETILKFDDYCEGKLNELNVDYSPVVAAMIEEMGYAVVPGSKEVVEKWRMFVEEGIKVQNSKYN